MIQPGAKNWIEKYFSLVEEGEINLNRWIQSEEITQAEFLHNVFFDSGIIFGYPVGFLFFDDEEVSERWTMSEKTTLLLFESLLLVYVSEKRSFVKEDFIASLLTFYQQYKSSFSLNILKLFFKESESIKLENIIESRVHVKKSIRNQFWVSYFNNSLVYLDVLAFSSFLTHEKQLDDSFDAFVSRALKTVGVMSMVDNEMTAQEKQILSVFLSASNMTEQEKDVFNAQLTSKSLTIQDILLPKEADVLYKYYLLDIAVLTVHSDLSVMNEEILELYNLCEYLKLPHEKLEHSMIISTRFIMENNHKITFLQDKSSYEQLYSNFSKRWIKVLGRNKDKLIEELKGSRELISLVNKSFTEELTQEEKTKVKEEFIDLVKSVPALAIFMLPGGAVLLPLILKIIPDLIPSAFKQNEIK